MANCKQRLHCHLLSAQQWLARAEQAFGKNRDVRGELDLFLAQAELQHAREANRTVHFRHKYVLCRHVAALTLALTVFFLILTGVHWSGEAVEQPSAGIIPPPLVQETAKQLAGSAVANGVMSLPAAVLPETGEKVLTTAAEEKIPQPEVAAVPVTENAQISRQRSVEQRPVAAQQSTQAPASDDVNLTPAEMQKLIQTAGKSLRGQ